MKRSVLFFPMVFLLMFFGCADFCEVQISADIPPTDPLTAASTGGGSSETVTVVYITRAVKEKSGIAGRADETGSMRAKTTGALTYGGVS